MNYANLPDQYSSPESPVHIIPVPHEGNVTYGEGAKNGPQHILKASQHIEYYDLETKTEPFQHGIHTQQPIHQHISDTLKTRPSSNLAVYLGGDHSTTIHTHKHHAIDTVILDAHADLRYSWKESTKNHACVTRRIQTNHEVLLDGVRALDQDEHSYAEQRDNLHLLTKKHSSLTAFTSRLNQLKDTVYLSIDVDALDPSVIAHTGTPEPDGYTYRELLTRIHTVFKHKDVVAVDIVEFAPHKETPQTRAEAYTLAKLIYTIIAYHHGK
jgi:agmatinase